MSANVIDQPLKVERVEGEIVILGPNGFSGSFTIDAARETAHRLATAVGEPDDGETYQKPLG